MVKYITFRQQERWFGPDVLMLTKELRNKLKSQYTSADNAEAGSELDGLVKATPHIKVFLQGPSRVPRGKEQKRGYQPTPRAGGTAGDSYKSFTLFKPAFPWTKFPL